MAIMFGMVLVLAVLSDNITGNDSKNVCTNLYGLPELRHNVSMIRHTFLTIANYSVMRCVKECLLRSLCRSINFNLNTSECGLNSRNSSQTKDKVITSSEYSVYSDIDLWPGRIAAQCEGHNCSLNHRCVVRSDGEMVCDIFGCLEPPPIPFGSIVTYGKMVWNFGEQQLYNCDHEKANKKGELICDEGGTWTSVSCGQ